MALHADNLLNRRYYDHTSYYRLIDVPEPGRNVSLMVGLEFKEKLTNYKIKNKIKNEK